jgi:hypothetical protein
MPPHAAAQPIARPPDSDSPTTAMLKGDIDSGRTGDKVEVYDPGLSPLGTDDEAAGRPPSAFRVALARHYETAGRWVNGARKTSPAPPSPTGCRSVFLGFIAAVSLSILVGIWLFSTNFVASPPA